MPPIATAELKLDDQVIVSIFLPCHSTGVVNDVSELPSLAVSLTDARNGIRPRATILNESSMK